MVSFFWQSNFREPGNRKEEKTDGCGQYGYIPARRNRFGRSERKNNGELVTYIEKADQEKKKEKGEGTVNRKQGKTYKVTSLGETDSSFCLKVIGSPDSSFVTRKVSSPYLPAVVD